MLGRGFADMLLTACPIIARTSARRAISRARTCSCRSARTSPSYTKTMSATEMCSIVNGGLAVCLCRLSQRSEMYSGRTIRNE